MLKCCSEINASAEIRSVTTWVTWLLDVRGLGCIPAGSSSQDVPREQADLDLEASAGPHALLHRLAERSSRPTRSSRKGSSKWVLKHLPTVGAWISCKRKSTAPSRTGSNKTSSCISSDCEGSLTESELQLLLMVRDSKNTRLLIFGLTAVRCQHFGVCSPSLQSCFARRRL